MNIKMQISKRRIGSGCSYSQSIPRAHHSVRVARSLVLVADVRPDLHEGSCERETELQTRSGWCFSNPTKSWPLQMKHRLGKLFDGFRAVQG
jgi:hypothetical protein